MFGFLRKPEKAKRRTPKPGRQRGPDRAPKHDATYDLMKKISDLQDQLSRHDSRIINRIEEHDDFLQTQHHEPMKKASIEMLNKLYNQPQPIREEVIKIIKTDEDILSVISDGKMSAGEVAGKLGLSREHTSRRISHLTRSGMLTRMQEGKRVFYLKAEE
jgi:DNA-binding transcriptional ArsR family regulator